MINDIIDGIATKLFEEFGSDYTIYRENVTQGLKEPAFIIKHVQSGSVIGRLNRYFRDNGFVVHYLPKDLNNAESEMCSVAEKLFLVLEYIFVLDNLERGTKMRYEIVDDTLHFFVNYNTVVERVKKPVDNMESLDNNTTVEE